ncbi:MAG: F0F1 ATP synthase subunit delta [Spirochaetaceae bacterium]|jgi:F0F1-type ATP synthase delta subunit|nr:F0F1 ATP synthase subunit delta [Spirochaetaceae bacterium]
MFAADRWANAFIKVCEGGRKAGADMDDDALRQCEAGLTVIKAVFHGLSHLHNVVSGSASASRLNGFLRAALQKCGYADKESGVEAACAVVFLLIQRDCFRHTGLLIDQIEDLLLKKRNILTVLLDCAEKPDDDFIKAVKTTLKEREGVRDVLVTTVLMPRLLGGYRINIGGKREDFSVLGRMKQLEQALAGG